MARSRVRGVLIPVGIAIIAGSVLGGFLGLAFAQDRGALDVACVGLCAANGYDGEFCQRVCWVPDPVAAAEGDRLDWKCIANCGERGGTARDCIASCRRY